MRNMNKKLALALTLVAAGSIFYGTSSAEAKGLELDGIQIVFGRHHDAPPPPPPPPHYPPHHHHMHMPPPPPPPPHFHHRPHRWAPRGPRHEEFGPRGRYDPHRR